MPSISRWMIAYGLLLIVCQVLDSMGIFPVGLQGRAFISGWAGGLLMVAAALSAAHAGPPSKTPASTSASFFPSCSLSFSPGMRLIFGGSEIQMFQCRQC